MINGVILTGHGNFATGLSSAVALVFGEADNFYSIDFSKEISPEVLEKKLIEKIEIMKDLDGILICTDIAGGTPFKTSALLSMTRNVKVVSGTNLSMLLEVLASKDDFELEELYNMALETGKDEVKGFELNTNRNTEENEEEDGI